jgi:uncharacterized protein YdeI (YjbR/CyaY-like superfamily)
MKSSLNPKVDAFIGKAKKWQKELELLRSIVLDCGLAEDFKWGHPCYTVDGKNIFVIQGFKEYCALMFFKGALLKDPKYVLIKTGENTQAGRQLRFTGIAQIAKLEKTIKSYVKEAAANEKAGLKVETKKISEYAVPEELKIQFDNNSKLKTSFESLTPGRQRAYLIFFSSAKQSQTREARIAKFIPKILKGKGMDD